MTEFWVSKSKKWCDFCRTFVYDNAASIKQHESTQKHKDNVQKGWTKSKQKKVQEEQQQKKVLAELKKVEQAVSGKGSGRGKGIDGYIPTFRGQPPPNRKPHEVGSTTYYAPPRAPSLGSTTYTQQNLEQYTSEDTSAYYYDPNYYNYYVSQYQQNVNAEQEITQQTAESLEQSTETTNNTEEQSTVEPVQLPKPKEPVFQPGYAGPYSAWTTVDKEDEILDKNQYEDIEVVAAQQETAKDDESDRSDGEGELHLKTKQANFSNGFDSDNSQVHFKRKSVSGTASRRKFRKKDTQQNED